MKSGSQRTPAAQKTWWRRYMAKNREVHLARRRARYAADPKKYVYLDPEQRRAYQKEWTARNRAAVNAYHKKWKAEHRDEIAARRITKLYGLTPEAFDALWKAQDGRCAICREPPTGCGVKGLHIDHDHATGKVRGLLCVPCNLRVGAHEDRLHAETMAYIARHK